MNNIVDTDPDNVITDLIEKRLKAGHQVHHGDKFSNGEMVAETLSP